MTKNICDPSIWKNLMNAIQDSHVFCHSLFCGQEYVDAHAEYHPT